MGVWAMGGQYVVCVPQAGSNPVMPAMSRSKRRTRREVPGDGCWLCDGPARKKKHKDKKIRPDPEQVQEIRDTHTSVV